MFQHKGILFYFESCTRSVNTRTLPLSSSCFLSPSSLPLPSSTHHYSPPTLILYGTHIYNNHSITHQADKMDRQTFLSTLLEEQNRVRVGEGSQDCFICKENFGEPSDGNEEAEYQVCLPCHGKHTMGSHCVTMWWEKHNTCPVCRAELCSAPVETDEDDQVLQMIRYWGRRVVLVTPVMFWRRI